MANTYLSRTNGTETTRTKATVSFWIKYNGRTSTTCILASSTDSNATFYFLVEFKPDLDIQIRDGSSAVFLRRRSNAKYRDVNGWYHVVISFDSTLATADDRIKIYVNGERITSFSTNTGTVGSNYNCPLFKTSSAIRIGSDTNGGNYLEGCLAHFHAIDGYAYDADTFGETDSTTGIWKPKTSPSVTYGTNGFFLDFADSSAMGNDVSGNNNDLTVSGTLTQTIDTPSNVFATYNANVTQTGGTSGRNASVSLSLANGNLSAGAGAAIFADQVSTLGFSKGKWYAEFQTTGDTYTAMGIVNQNFIDAYLGDYIGSEATSAANNIGYQSVTGVVKKNDSTQYTGSTFTSADDIIGVAVDLDNNYIYFHKNGTYQNSGDPTSGATGTGGVSITADEYFFAVSSHNNAASGTEYVHANFGNGYFGTTAVSSAGTNAGIGTFEYNVPSGYKALCTKNINAEEYS